MKTNLYSLMLGSIAYNVIMIFTAERRVGEYVYAAGVMGTILVVGLIMDYFDKKKTEEPKS